MVSRAEVRPDVAALRALPADPAVVPAHLVAHSHLPGPRGNLELAHAFAAWASDDVVDGVVTAAATTADASAAEYLAFCGALGLGERLGRGADSAAAARLKAWASDPRWRVREGVATGLQRLGDHDLPRLLALVDDWLGDGDPYVVRAAVAAICEPRLLVTAAGAKAALDACAHATAALLALEPTIRRQPPARTLRQALGYAWSVAVAADPAQGLPAFAALRASADPDGAWVARENLKKARLRRLLDD